MMYKFKEYIILQKPKFPVFPKISTNFACRSENLESYTIIYVDGKKVINNKLYVFNKYNKT